MDIILHDGKMWSDVKRVESQLYQVICEVRLGMYVRGPSHTDAVLQSLVRLAFGSFTESVEGLWGVVRSS